MPTCCVFGCHNGTDNSSNLHFYRIPVGSHPFQKRRRLLWLQAIKHVHWTEDLIKTARVCSQHFISGKASVESESPDFVPSVFPCTDQSRKLQTDHQSSQRKKTVDDAALPGEKRGDISVADDRPELAKARKSLPTSVPVMKKRKISDSVEILPPKVSNASETADPLHRPVKQFSKAEIQQLIKQEILASLQQSEHKMDELIRRIQKTDSVPKYDAIIFRLQADIKKIKRREQVALAYIRKIKPDAQAPPAGHTQVCHAFVL
ncbi:hypothetical protein GJAV_G00217330 [Gymnothorax javanicus]|nr:hypothetical protein GJAV_G00217330 [Gymnothorax javanicus]